MDDKRVGDEFKRIELTATLDRTRDLITRYAGELVIRREDLEETQYLLGRLDERLGGGEHDDHI